MESTLASEQVVALRGAAVDRESWPARDASHSFSPSGETRKDGLREARRRSSRPPWQRAGDKRDARLPSRRGARNKPKRLRALRSGESVRGSTSGAFHESEALRAGANPLSFVLFAARRARRTHRGNSVGDRWPKRLGTHRPRKRHRVLRRTRRLTRGCARTLLSHCRNRRTARLKEALPPYASALQGAERGRGEREPGLRMYQSLEVASPP